MNEYTKEEIIIKLEETQKVDENKQEIVECDTNTEQPDDNTTEKIYSDDGPLMSEFEIECFDDVAEKCETRTKSPDDVEENITGVDTKTNNYEKHFKRTQNLDEIICDNEKSEEEKTLSGETHIELPMPSHSEKKPFKCDICNKDSITSRCLKVDKAECSVCHSIFYWTSMLLDTVEKPITCTICMVPRSKNKNIQADEKLHECNICGKTFLSDKSMLLHQKSHSSGKPYQCKICSKKFTEESTLNHHSKFHTKKKLLIFCPVKGCFQTFGYKSTLYSHLEMHKTKFMQTENPSLNAHQSIHTREKPFTCPVEDCSKSFRYKSQFSNHIRKHTGEFFNCSICGEFFTNQSLFTQHMLIHPLPYKCEICHIKFSEKESQNQSFLTQHMLMHTLTYKCEICHIKFSEKETLTNHLKIHIGDIQFTGSVKDTSEENFNDPEKIKTEDCVDILEENISEVEIKTEHCIKSENEVEFHLEENNKM